MERYDGKTKRDDYLKYGLIGLGAVAVIVGLSILTHYLRKQAQWDPDYRVVVASEEALNQEQIQWLESYLGSAFGGTVEVAVLRLVDYAAAQGADEAAVEEYLAALEAGDSDAELVQKFSGVTPEEDFNRMFKEIVDGECDLFLLSDQPRGEFQGAAATYCTAEYFLELPENLRSDAYVCAVELTDADFLQELGLGGIPFYGCVLDRNDGDGLNLLGALTES